MRIDNFTTGRCKTCGWTKQFNPGKDFQPQDFECDCKKVEEAPKAKAKKEAPKKDKPVETKSSLL